jgi:hypothetical protein
MALERHENGSDDSVSYAVAAAPAALGAAVPDSALLRLTHSKRI